MQKQFSEKMVCQDIINVDITPEFATRLGAAYGSSFYKNAKVVVSSTTSNSVRMFKHAFVLASLSWS